MNAVAEPDAAPETVGVPSTAASGVTKTSSGVVAPVALKTRNPAWPDAEANVLTRVAKLGEPLPGKATNV